MQPTNFRERAALASAALRQTRRGAAAAGRTPSSASHLAGSWSRPILRGDAHSSADHCLAAISWGNFPVAARAALHGAGWASLDDVRHADDAVFRQAVADSAPLQSLKPWLLLTRGAATDDVFANIEASVNLASQVPDTICEYIGADPGKRRRTSANAPPREQVAMLEHAQAEGFDAIAIVDMLLVKKMHASAGKSMTTYISLARTAHAFCALLGLPFLPTNARTIYRLAALITHEGTLRVLLAAWRKFHHIAGFHWPAEHSPVLADIRAGARKLQAPHPARPRIRKQTLFKLLKHCAASGEFFRGMGYALAYSLLLRVPSELLGQLRPCLLRVDEGKLVYGPIRRKGQYTAQSFVEAPCVRSHEPLLCGHMWATWLLATGQSSEALVYPPRHYARFIADLRADLIAVGMPRVEASCVASHAFRHGAALDIHEVDGLAAACTRGGWRSSAVTSYIPPSTIESRALAEALCEGSEDEPG